MTASDPGDSPEGSSGPAAASGGAAVVADVPGRTCPARARRAGPRSPAGRRSVPRRIGRGVGRSRPGRPSGRGGPRGGIPRGDRCRWGTHRGGARAGRRHGTAARPSGVSEGVRPRTVQDDEIEPTGVAAARAEDRLSERVGDLHEVGEPIDPDQGRRADHGLGLGDRLLVGRDHLFERRYDLVLRAAGREPEAASQAPEREREGRGGNQGGHRTGPGRRGRGDDRTRARVVEPGRRDEGPCERQVEGRFLRERLADSRDGERAGEVRLEREGELRPDEADLMIDRLG